MYESGLSKIVFWTRDIRIALEVPSESNRTAKVDSSTKFLDLTIARKTVRHIRHLLFDNTMIGIETELQCSNPRDLAFIAIFLN
jgi:hypothetical protein